jgi:galactonate dehydratase
MEITSFETFSVQPRWVFLRVETDTGHVGWGEPNLEGKADAVLGALAELEDYFVGKDPRRTEHHWQAVYRGSFYHRGAVLNSALAGIDQALWDLKGKELGVPVYELLGGPTRESVRVYAPVVGDESPERLDGPPELLAERAIERVEDGYDAIKVIPFAETWPVALPDAVDAIEARVRAVREAVGPGVDVAIDAHGKLSPAMARRVLVRLEPYEPMFVEEPVRPEHDHRLNELRSSTEIPLATGERRFSRWDFRELCPSSVDVFQPDPSHAGGISEVRRIAALAETHGISMAPHCPLGPVAVAAAAHVDCAIPNFLIQETPGFYGGSVDQYTAAGFTVEDGSLHLSGDPGLGVDVDEDELRAADNQGHDQYIPTRTHEDGSVADW